MAWPRACRPSRHSGGTCRRARPWQPQQNLGPVLISRLDVRMLSPLPAGPVRWVVLTKIGSLFGAAEHADPTWLAEQPARPGVVVTERDGVVLVRLPAPEIVRLPAP